MLGTRKFHAFFTEARLLLLSRLKALVKAIPLVGRFSRYLHRKFFTRRPNTFKDSEDYWIRRYATGGNSGSGSYDELAAFKIEVLNDFVKSHEVRSIIEFGCGDGNQLREAQYPSYVGYDISPYAVRLCRRLYSEDNTKEFKLLSDYHGENAELTLSLDVIFHLVEDDVYEEYMGRLFAAATRYVIVYSSNTDTAQKNHERHRQFTTWVEKSEPAWELIQHIPNRYPFEGLDAGSLSDFFIYELRTAA